MFKLGLEGVSFCRKFWRCVLFELCCVWSVVVVVIIRGCSKVKFGFFGCRIRVSFCREGRVFSSRWVKVMKVNWRRVRVNVLVVGEAGVEVFRARIR